MFKLHIRMDAFILRAKWLFDCLFLTKQTYVRYAMKETDSNAGCKYKRSNFGFRHNSCGWKWKCCHFTISNTSTFSRWKFFTYCYSDLPVIEWIGTLAIWNAMSNYESCQSQKNVNTSLAASSFEWFNFTGKTVFPLVSFVPKPMQRLNREA